MLQGSATFYKLLTQTAVRCRQAFTVHHLDIPTNTTVSPRPFTVSASFLAQNGYRQSENKSYGMSAARVVSQVLHRLVSSGKAWLRVSPIYPPEKSGLSPPHGPYRLYGPSEHLPGALSTAEQWQRRLTTLLLPRLRMHWRRTSFPHVPFRRPA